MRGDSVRVHSTDTDAVARHLLTQTAACDLEIDSRGIEDAFIALTADAQDDPTPTVRSDHDHRPRRTRTPRPNAAFPPLGGLNTTLLRIELRRVLRNRRTMIITLVMPVVFFLIFGLPRATPREAPAGERRGVHHDQHGRCTAR